MDEIFSDITLATLAKLPADRPVSLVVRHAPRVAIHSYNEVYVAGLTPEGIAAAVDFGARLAQLRTLRRIVSSPVSRCVNTALAVARGAAWQQFVRIDDRISHPFISPVWLSLSTLHYPVTPVPAELAAIVRMLTAVPGGPGMLDLYITHDTIVGSLAGYFAGQ